MLHWASTAKVVRPLALDAGVLPEAATGVGVAQIHGCVWALSRIGPPRTWLVIVRLAHGRPLPLPLASATKVLSPGAMPVSTPRRVRLSSSATNEAPTSAPLSVSVTFFIGTVLGTCTSTSASPSLTRSARLDSVRISKLNGGSCALAGAILASAPSGIAAPPPNPATTSSAMPSAPIRTACVRIMMSPPSCTARLGNRLDANAPPRHPASTLIGVRASHNQGGPAMNEQPRREAPGLEDLPRCGRPRRPVLALADRAQYLLLRRLDPPRASVPTLPA